MTTYRLTGDYGTFEIRKTIEASNHQDAWCETGIMVDLMEAGWSILAAPEGEEWTVEMLADDKWVVVDEDDEEEDD